MPHDRPRRPVSVLGLLLLVVILPLIAGCPERTGTVSGTVKFQDKPLPGGLITFEPKTPGHNPATAFIDEQGHYEATMPVGEYLIMVDNTMLEHRVAKGPPPGPLPPGIKVPASGKQVNPETLKDTGAAPSTGPKGKYVAIPPKFTSTATSGLSYTVVAGPQPHDVELK